MKKNISLVDLFKFDPEIENQIGIYNKTKDIHLKSLISMGRISVGDISSSDTKEVRVKHDSTSSTKILKFK